MNLLPVTAAEQIILKMVQVGTGLKPVPTDITKAVGMVLAENIFADRDQPATDRSSMDGIAISFSSWQKGCRKFRIEGMQKAGIPQKNLRKHDGCFEIMTGSVLPKGTDCVVPVEVVEFVQGQAVIKTKIKFARFQFVRRQASEYKKATLLIKKATQLQATHIAVIASVGKNKVKVFSPKIAVIGTGDELVEINKPVKPHQARRSNAYALEALFYSHGFTDVTKFHSNDNISELKRNLKRIIADYDVLVLSGGVSMGKFDFIPQVLQALDVKVLFHKVSQKPGKPFWFGRNKEGKAVFALPGNPVSTLVCAVRYVLPYLQKSCGLKLEDSSVSLAKSVKQNSNLTLFIPVSVHSDLNAVPVSFAGSGDYGSLTKSDGFVEIPKGKGVWKKGEKVRYFRW